MASAKGQHRDLRLNVKMIEHIKLGRRNDGSVIVDEPLRKVQALDIWRAICQVRRALEQCQRASHQGVADMAKFLQSLVRRTNSAETEIENLLHDRPLLCNM